MAGPDFIGIGAQKAATTWLFKRLCMHPDIYFPRGKEIHFWDQQEGKPERPIKQYQQIFSGPANAYFGDKSGEITPRYLGLSEARIRELAALVPQVRLIVILRDPVERALSAATQHHLFRPEEAQQSDPLFWSRTTEPGFYAKHLSRWLRHFPREQLLVLKFDDISRDPLQVLKRTARHIGVDPGIYDLIDLSLLAKPFFQSEDKVAPDAAMIAQLRDLYRADVADLERMLGKPMGWWD